MKLDTIAILSVMTELNELTSGSSEAYARIVVNLMTLSRHEENFLRYKDFIANKIYNRLEVTEDEYNSPEVRVQFDEFVAGIRRGFQTIMNQYAQDEQAQRKIKFKAVIDKLNTRHKPTQFGTTDEIAEKYNLSKKQVRKMKADGTLEEFIQNQLKEKAQ